MAPARSTFGAVSFGSSSTPRHRGGEAAGLIPIDPESLAIDGEKLAPNEHSTVQSIQDSPRRRPSTGARFQITRTSSSG